MRATPASSASSSSSASSNNRVMEFSSDAKFSRRSTTGWCNYYAAHIGGACAKPADVRSLCVARLFFSTSDTCTSARHGTRTQSPAPVLSVGGNLRSAAALRIFFARSRAHSVGMKSRSHARAHRAPKLCRFRVLVGALLFGVTVNGFCRCVCVCF